MNNTSTKHTVLADAVFSAALTGKSAQAFKIFGIPFLMSLFIVASAQLSVPFYPVPVTGQTFAVMLAGLLLGRRGGVMSVAMYMAQGFAGLPVFAGGKFGIATMFGPTGGYLLGFLVAAYICGYFAEKGWDRSYAKVALAFVLAQASIYALGVAWLGTIVGWDKPVMELGLYPFLLGDMLKMALIAVLLPTCWKLKGRHS